MDHARDDIIAICDSKETAHTLGETVSYLRHGNALYGLFRMEVVRFDVLTSDITGRAMLDRFLHWSAVGQPS